MRFSFIRTLVLPNGDEEVLPFVVIANSEQDAWQAATSEHFPSGKEYAKLSFQTVLQTYCFTRRIVVPDGTEKLDQIWVQGLNYHDAFWNAQREGVPDNKDDFLKCCIEFEYLQPDGVLKQ